MCQFLQHKFQQTNSLLAVANVSFESYGSFHHWRNFHCGFSVYFILKNLLFYNLLEKQLKTTGKK